MFDILQIVLPVFALIALGFGTVATGYLKVEVGDGLAAFVFNIAIPVLLFRAMAAADFSDASPWALWVSYFTGVASVWILAALIIRHLFKRGARAGVIAGVSAGFSNLVLLGIPLVDRAYGEAGLTLLLLIISVHLPLMMTSATLLIHRAAYLDGASKAPARTINILADVARNLIKNPIIIGIMSGLVWRLTGWELDGIPAQIVNWISQTAGPLALIAVGMGLIKYSIRGNIIPALGLSALSLILFPAIVYLMAGLLFDLPTLWIQVAVLGAAAPTGVNAYLFAVHFDKAQGLATNTIVITITGAVFTLPLWLAFLSQLS